MIERSPKSPELLPPSESIAGATKFWLSEEIKSSMSGSNAYLDNMETFIADGHAKVINHFGRLELWTELFAKYPTDNQAITRQLFGVQTGLSGAFRTQCYISAKETEDYTNKRTARPLGVNIEEIVHNRLIERFSSLPNNDDLILPTITAGELVTQTKEVNRFRLETLSALHDDPRHKQGLRVLFYHMRLSRLQQRWLELGVDYTLHAAFVNGGTLDKIEFLEPLPITKAQPYRPFDRS